MAKISEIAVIGAGFAGAATAYFLHRAGVTDCVILEAAERPGSRASGLNAAMGRQVIADRVWRRLAREGMRFLRHPPAGFSDVPLIDDRGSLLIFSPEDLGRARALAEAAQRDGIATELWTAEQIGNYLPIVRGTGAALWTPSDGLIDIHALLCGFLQPARAAHHLICNARVMQLSFSSDAWTIATTAGEFRARILVNAAGAWGNPLAALAGAETLDLQVRRRHLFVSAPTSAVSRNAPFVWDLSRNYYFRPKSDGIMLSACDEDVTSPDQAFETAPGARSLLTRKLSEFCPALSDLPILHTWAGGRTFAPQGEPIIRWDHRVPQFFWVAGLGGHGATCASSIGRQAATILAVHA